MRVPTLTYFCRRHRGATLTAASALLAVLAAPSAVPAEATVDPVIAAEAHGIGVSTAGLDSAASAGRESRILFCAPTPCHNLFSMRPDGTDVRQVTHVRREDAAKDGSWSPDGRHILFRVLHPSSSPVSEQIWVVRSDGTHPRPLLRDLAFRDLNADYAPDGTKVVFSRCRHDFSACAVYRVYADGTHLHALTPFRDGELNLLTQYSPDGRLIAFGGLNHRAIPGAVYLMRADGTHVHRITPAWIGGFAPTWSPTVADSSSRVTAAAAGRNSSGGSTPTVRD